MLFWGLVALALLLMVSLGFMPLLVRLRIKVLRWLNWHWAASLLERHFEAWVLVFRIFVLGIAAVLLLFAFGSVANAQEREPGIALCFDGCRSGLFRQSGGDVFGHDAEQRADNDRNNRR
jgi:hypothetical protein